MRVNKIKLNAFEEDISGKDIYSDNDLQLVTSMMLKPASRGKAPIYLEKDLDKDSVLEFIFEDGTRWISGTDSLDTVFPEAANMINTRGVGEFRIPESILTEDSNRGLAKEVLLKAVNIFTKRISEKQTYQLAKHLEDRFLEDEEGLFSVHQGFQLKRFNSKSSAKPHLLLIHGTGSNTRHAFGDLENSGLLTYLMDTYEERVLTFHHRSITKNPIENVRDLVESLPDNITLHLITISSGGLVGEVLSRFCDSLTNRNGFNLTELNILKKGYPEDYYTELVQLIEEIRTIVSNKNIRIEKFIRIACPTGGTHLASKRLDTFLNVSLNLIGFGTGIATNPIFIAFKKLISSIVGCKANPAVLPGLEALAPDSPFIRAINCDISLDNHNDKSIINNSLIVISGNSLVPLRLSALLVIVSKIFFQRKNDLIVDTESMCMGTPRTGKVLQFFYEGTDINHLKYFKSQNIRNAISRSLTREWGQELPGFSHEPLSIPVRSSRGTVLKLDGGQAFCDSVSGSKPILILIPGIMGSNLGIRDADRGQPGNDNLIWIKYSKLIRGGLADLSVQNPQEIRALSLVASSYESLIEYFKDSYDIVTFAYDWRLDLKDSAKSLNQLVQTYMKAYNQPIRMIGHSMGGVLAREFIVNHTDTWNKLNERDGFRLILLGTPLQGSFRIPAILLGKDKLIKKLAFLDILHNKKELTDVVSRFRGLLSLLPFDEEGDYDFSKKETWEKMRVAMDDKDWPIPAAEDLKWFADYRKRMRDALKDDDYKNIIYVAGSAPSTPNGYMITDYGDEKELEFLCTAEGDNSVTWANGIPQVLSEKGKVYFVNVSHGALACEPSIFKGISELLTAGHTHLFSTTKPSVRGENLQFRMNEPGDLDLSEFNVVNELLGLGSTSTIQKIEVPINIVLSHGDLLFSSYPLMAGHFENDGILSAEKVIDSKLENALSHRHQYGLYPGPIGSSEVFISRKKGLKGALIIGLGKQEELTASELARSVERGVLNYLLQAGQESPLSESLHDMKQTCGISSLLIASAYAGLSVDSSVRAIIQGVHNANTKIRNLNTESSRVIEEIEFIELYEDKSVNALYSLRSAERDSTKSFNIHLADTGIRTLMGSRKRIPRDHTEEWWNRITILANKPENTEKVHSLKFSASTYNAQVKVEKLFTTPALIEGIIQEMSVDDHWSTEKARALFELLIPIDFKESLQKHGNINWIVDPYTASFPWELLQDSSTDSKPLCVSSGMIRQLHTMNYRKVVKTSPNNNALVIADPDTKGYAIQLAGALKEGHEVMKVLNNSGMNVVHSFKENSDDIIQKLFSQEYRVLHLSGHGMYSSCPEKGSGMLIGNNLFLSTRELQQLSTVPDLVFVNCCHLGKSDDEDEELYQDRFRLSASIGIQLINMGVKCVIAAGWAVNDRAALEFARVFYEEMFKGNNFGDSIKEARKSVYKSFGSTNTWGAYQCYGDPFFRFEHIRRQKKETERVYMIPQEAEVDLSNLLNGLEVGNRTKEEYLALLEEISEAVDMAKIRTPLITEKEARIYQECGEYKKACDKFEILFSTEDASFSFSAAEKYYNSRAKQIVAEFNDKNGSKQKPGGKFVSRINEVITELETLIKLSPTSERINILASTVKRKGLLSVRYKLETYSLAADRYKEAYQHSNNWYSLTNWFALRSTINIAQGKGWENIEIASGSENYTLSKEEALKLLDKEEASLVKDDDYSSYWNMLARNNISMCRCLILYGDKPIEKDFEAILNNIISIWELAGSKSKQMADIEQLEFLIDILNKGKTADALKLRDDLNMRMAELKNTMGE